jgi:hypothetical protein
MLALVASVDVLDTPSTKEDVVGLDKPDHDEAFPGGNRTLETKRPAADIRYGPRNEPTAMS